MHEHSHLTQSYNLTWPWHSDIHINALAHGTLPCYCHLFLEALPIMHDKYVYHGKQRVLGEVDYFMQKPEKDTKNIHNCFYTIMTQLRMVYVGKGNINLQILIEFIILYYIATVK